MKLSTLLKKYINFEQCTYTVFVNKKEVYPDKDFRIERIHMETSIDIMANFCEIDIVNIKVKNSFMSDLATGAVILIKGGYQKNEKIIFEGYIQSVSATCIKHGYLEKAHIYAQDVKGLMMLCKSAQITSGQKRSTVLQEILQASFYKKYVDKVKIDTIPTALDALLYRDGTSDYDVVEHICEDCFYSCYVAADTLYFKERHKKESTTLIIDEWAGIDFIEVEASMENQIGNVRVTTCDGFESKKEAKESYALSDMPFSSKMSDILSATACTIVDNSYESLDEVKAIAKGFVNEAKHSYGKMRGEGVFLSEYVIGTGIEVSEFVDDKSKSGYLSKVIHTIDESGARSQWEAILTKG